MPKYKITAPDGKAYVVTAPEGATQEQVLAYAQQHYGKQAQPDAPAASPEDHDSGLSLSDLITGRRPEHNGLGSDSENFWAGMGKSVVDQGRGLYQSGLALAKLALSGEGAVSSVLGREDVLGDSVRSAYAESKQAETEARQRDAPLMGTKAGIAGNIAGYGAQIAFPAAALRSTALANAALPTTTRGMALQGALMGATKPLATGEGEGSRLTNLAIGGGAGASGALAPRLIGAGARGLASLAQPFTKRGQEVIAASALREMAENPASLSTLAPSGIAGVKRTLAEETLDPGIAQLQRQYPVQLAGQQAQNNAARAGAIRSTFHGADAAGEQAAKDAATRAAVPLLKQAQRSGAQVKTESVIALADKLAMASKGNPAAVNTIQLVREQLTTPNGPERGVAALYNARKYIDDLLAGRAGGDTNAAKSAAVQLHRIKDLLDRQIAKAEPAFAQYLAIYRHGMKPANQAAIGAEMLDRAGAVADPVTGERSLTPAAFSRSTNDLDQLASRATGFGKAKAGSILTPDQRAVIAGVRDDLARLNFANTAGRGTGSPTAGNLATQNVLSNVTRGLGAGKSIIALEPVKRITGVMEKTYSLFGIPERLHDTISTALADPAYARQIIAKLPDADRATVEAVVSRLTGPGASIVSETHKQ